MLTNKEIALKFNLLAKLMELHGDNPFKIKSYTNAYLSLKKIDNPLADYQLSELGSLPGIGKSIVSKIEEILATETLVEIEKYKEITPEGVIDMLSIKGFGPKKVKAVWKDLGVESAGELLYACKENRLISLSGFGLKTQDTLIKSLNYFLDSKGKFLFYQVVNHANELVDKLQTKMPQVQFSLVGDVAKMNNIVDSIDILHTGVIDDSLLEGLGLEKQENEYHIDGRIVKFIATSKENFEIDKFKQTSDDNFLSNFNILPSYKTEQEIFESNNTPFIPSECRTGIEMIDLFKNHHPTLIEENDIKGVIHCHTTYSDGLHSVKDMALYAKSLGYEYIVITDHSKSAFYANGLSIERLEMQWNEIDALNHENLGIQIYKGIESDILNDGNLDYDDDLLKCFDLIIASVHSNLKMDEEKANVRLIKAIENQYTTMLGHPTGRLLLSREGYPIDHKKIIDACASNNVSIEINANPQRLDIDYKWIPYCLQKGVRLSINPDAHSKDAIQHIKWGVIAARKGGLDKENCINSMDKSTFDAWINKS